MDNPENESRIMDDTASLVVGVPVRGQLHYVRQCLEALRRYRSPRTRILIIDDASDNECREYLHEFANTTQETDLLCHSSPKGFPYNCNEIIYHSHAPNICLLNSDTLVTPGWDEKMVDVLKTDSRVGLTGPSTSHCHTAQALPYFWTNRMQQGIDSVGNISDLVYACFQGECQEMPLLGGFCLCFKREVVRRIGYFDERFSPGSGEEDDYVIRARRAGYRAIWVKYVYVHHFAHRSFAAEWGEASRRLWRRNYFLLRMKWLFPSMGEIVHPPPCRDDIAHLCPQAFRGRYGL